MVVVVAERAVEMRDGVKFDLVNAMSKVTFGMKDYFRRRAAQRRLEALDDRMLEDIGMTRADIRAHIWAR